MVKRRLLRKFGIAAIALIAIGAIGYAVNNSGGGGSNHEGNLPTTAGAIGISATPSTGAAQVGVDSSVANTTKASVPTFSEGAPELAPAAGPQASSVGSVGAGPASQAGDLTSTLDRKIVSTASIDMQVDDVGQSFEDVGRIASSAGGFVANSSFTYQGDRQLASVTIRVPADSYQNVLASLRKLGVKVDAESSDANDVTGQYTDLGSRLRTLQATETQLMTLLAKASTITDILTVQDRLNNTQGEIDQVKGQMQLLDNLTSLATITVHLQPVVVANGADHAGNGVDLGAEISKAWDNSIQFLGEIAAGVLTVVVFAWWVPLAGLPVLLGYKALTRHRTEAVD